MGTRYAYNLKAFDNNVLFNIPNDYLYHDLCPIQLFDLGPFLMVTGGKNNFKIAIINRGTKLHD